jgi:hypothetical protein
MKSRHGGARLSGEWRRAAKEPVAFTLVDFRTQHPFADAVKLSLSKGEGDDVEQL